jgi:hypothetical protein
MDIEACKLMTEWAKILGAFVIFLVGLYQYTRAQTWKRREFIASQMKDFEADKGIRATMKMLDWHDRHITFPSDIGDNPVVIRVDELLLCSALLPHDNAGQYSADEAVIRDSFDRFLDMLVRLFTFVKARLISTEELRPYVIYWIRIMNGDLPQWHTAEFRVLLLNYIKIYHFDGAAKLVADFGFNPTASEGVLKSAVDTIMVSRDKRKQFHRRPSPDQVAADPSADVVQSTPDAGTA